MIDWSRVDELRAEIGDEDFDEVVEIFLEEVDQGIAVIGDGPPLDKIEDHLHFLAGSALNLGFSAFSALCKSGEAAAAQGNFGEIDLPRVVDTYRGCKAEFLAGLKARATL